MNPTKWSFALLTAAMLLAANMGGQPPAHFADGSDGSDRQNTRTWRPGEPLDWVRTGLIDSLIQEGFDSFNITAESPREKGYTKLVHYMRQDTMEILYVEGDLRYLCYDPLSRTNSSQSVVVGYNYYCTPYWFDGEWCFQNGQSNWYRHSHRHFHSRQNWQIEMRDAGPAPDGVDKALVFAGDSACYFLTFEGKLEESEKPALVYTLRHNSQDWQYLGRLHPSIQRLHNETQGVSLKDYWVFFYSGSAVVVRKHDLAITQRPSKVAVAQKAKRESFTVSPNKWKAVNGNTVHYNWKGRTVVEDFDEVLMDAQWNPLFVPFDLPDTTTSSEMESLLALFIALLFGGFGGTFLMQEMRTRRRKRASDAVPTDPGQPTPMLDMLMSRRGQLLSTQALDQLFNLNQIVSSETRRSRRSRMIQMINMESLARYGNAIIHRERSEVDKRIMNYRIELDETEKSA